MRKQHKLDIEKRALVCTAIEDLFNCYCLRNASPQHFARNVQSMKNWNIFAYRLLMTTTRSFYTRQNEAIFLITMLMMCFLSYMPGGNRWCLKWLRYRSNKETFLNPQLSTVFIIVTWKRVVDWEWKNFSIITASNRFENRNLRVGFLLSKLLSLLNLFVLLLLLVVFLVKCIMVVVERIPISDLRLKIVLYYCLHFMTLRPF
jgi:hypothetical protein